MQLLGSVIGCLFGDSLDTLISMSLFSYLLAYMLYLAVIVSQKEGLMAVAIGFYAVYAVAIGFYALLNAMHMGGSWLVFATPPRRCPRSSTASRPSRAATAPSTPTRSATGSAVPSRSQARATEPP